MNTFGLNLDSWQKVSDFLSDPSSIQEKLQAALNRNLGPARASLAHDWLNSVAAQNLSKPVNLTITIPEPAAKVFSADEMRRHGGLVAKRLEAIQVRQKIRHAGTSPEAHDRRFTLLQTLIGLENFGLVGQDNALLVMQFSMLQHAIHREFDAIMTEGHSRFKDYGHSKNLQIPGGPFAPTAEDKALVQDLGMKDSVLQELASFASQVHDVDNIPGWTPDRS